jgi:small conductance mechanosensitive channel
MLDQVFSYMDLTRLLNEFITWLPHFFAAALIFSGLLFLHRLASRPVKLLLDQIGLDRAFAALLMSLFRAAILITATVMAAGQLGFNVGAAMAGIGVAGLTIGFAAKDSLSNVIAGFLIVWDKPFVSGDWITMAGESGCVSEITMRTTRIRTRENTYVVIPNQTVINEVLVNHSKNGSTRLNVSIGIAYKEYIPAAREVLLRAVATVGGISPQPPPDVVVESLGDSSVNLHVRVWVEDAENAQVLEPIVLEACKLALDEAGIEIPFPHLQFFLDNVDDGVWKKLRGALAPQSDIH